METFNRNDTIAGIPILKIRKLFRFGRFLIEHIQQDLGVNETEALRIATELQQLDYIIKDKEGFYAITGKAKILGSAKAINPISRKKADELFKAFIERIETVNTDPKYLFRVTGYDVHGSYKSNDENIGTINILVHLQEKESDPVKHRKLEQEKRDYVQKQEGKRFSNMVRFYSFPEDEVIAALKAGIRRFNISWTKGKQDITPVNTPVENEFESIDDLLIDNQKEHSTEKTISQTAIVSSGELVLNERKGRKSKRAIERKAIVYPQTLENKHGQILDELVDILRANYPGSQFNPECLKQDCDSRIDIVRIDERGKRIFYEIKTYTTVLSSIRMAIGQLLEYAFYPEVSISDEFYIVSHLPASPSELLYLKHISKKIGVTIGYIHYDLASKKIEENPVLPD